jgi:hypothetical protein
MNLYESMQYRMPWTVASDIMSRVGIPVGQGWDKTIDKISNLKKDGEDFRNIESDCLNEYKKHILYGEKNIKFYNVNKEDIENINKSIDKIVIQKNAFTESYPYVVDEDELKTIKPGLNLLEIIEENSGRYLVYGSKKYIEYRERTSEIPDAIREHVGEIDEIIYIRHGVRQFFDVSWVPYSEGIIELRADSPKDINDTYTYTHRGMIGVIEDGNNFQSLKNSINLFPLIRKIYDAEDEGYVVEMEFITSTASSKKERMRKSKTDLRAERYHQAGSSAIHGKFDPYKLCVRWPTEDESTHPELIIKGNSRAIFSKNPFIADATIRWCSTDASYSLITDKIFNYLAE